jgi:hypothetical protein
MVQPVARLARVESARQVADLQVGKRVAFDERAAVVKQGSQVGCRRPKALR